MTAIVTALTDFHRNAASSLTLMEDPDGGAVCLADGASLGAAEGYDGHCAGRFYANIVTAGLEYRGLKAGDTASVGGAVLEIARVGKHCYDMCRAADKSACPLKSNCAFASVIKGGTIEPGDKIALRMLT